MIDIHCHILPGLDDGARDLDEAIQMARILLNQGVAGIVATPHFLEGSNPPPKDSVIQACTFLAKALREADIDVDIYPGMEVLICPELAVLVKDEKVLTINNKGKHLLFELPFNNGLSCDEHVIFELLLAGITPILAHPERYHSLDIEMLGHWIERGVLLQVNSSSFTGFYGKKAQKKAERLLLSNMVHFIASDGHSAGKRAPSLEKARMRVTALAGKETAEELFYTNPLKVIQGERVEAKPFTPITGPKLYYKLLQSRL